MPKIKKTMDGNEAAAYASYAFTEVAAIYPITPSSPMAEAIDRWSATGRKNIFGQEVSLIEMQSEAGAIAALHGALEAGSLATSYTSSQGLMLMIPTMYRIAGQLKPCVIHVASRTVGTHAVSIFAENSDVMACRQTGFALLASSSVQECMDLGAVAHLSAIKGHVPFMHFFDGFRTSHEIQKIDLLDYDDLKGLVDYEELRKFRQSALNPEHPVLRTTGQNTDTYFQSREAVNPYYNALPEVVEYNMNQINRLTGKNYQLYEYYGDDDAENIIITLGSVCGTIREVIDHLQRKGEKAGLLEIHLYRPFAVEKFLSKIPPTVKKITVLNRTKEPGAVGEPLYEDVCSAYANRLNIPEIYNCRFGLAGKDTTPAQIVAVYANMKEEIPKTYFTLGIDDDLSHISLSVGPSVDTATHNTTSCKFWGLGSDGTVGANKNTIKIIGDHTDMFVQAYFEYDGKKSGGVTRSHLRFGHSPIQSAYLVSLADFVACHNQSYIEKYDITKDIKDGGSLLLSCSWKEEELGKHLPAHIKREIAEKHINLYIIDAVSIAGRLGLGNRTNTVLQSAFFYISNIIKIDDAKTYMKEAIRKTYGKKGENVVQMNCAAVDAGIEELVKVRIPASWAEKCVEEEEKNQEDSNLPVFISRILNPVNLMKGDDIPVSAFADSADGTVPAGTSIYEKRFIAPRVPHWKMENCIQCNQCSFVCPHAAIRPVLLNVNEKNEAPESFLTITASGRDKMMAFRIQIDPADCQGCGSCVEVCPAKIKALVMSPVEEEASEQENWNYAMTVSEKKLTPINVKNSQFRQPLLEFPGACGGCGETPYAKLITQLFGDRMYIAAATGCNQVWATSFPSFPYSKNKEGKGPAVGGSLFENNAEFGLGIYLAEQQQRKRLKDAVSSLMETTYNEKLKALCSSWLENAEDPVLSAEKGKELIDACKNDSSCNSVYITEAADHLSKKSVWIFGGDGWAYDIGFGGLDHVLASGANVNIFVFDTEVYSNTGGQASKATPTGAVAQFASAGKKTRKKDLGKMAMGYENVYVAQVAMGADKNQLIKVLLEAESFNGPSLIIGYAPCINHGLRCGMNHVQEEMKKAVDVGYWQLYHYDPRLKKEGKNPFILDSKEPVGDFGEFLKGEVRYFALERTFPDTAAALYAKCENDAKERYESYKTMAKETGK